MVACQADKVIPEFVRLTCENMENPLGVDSEAPLFSWVIENTGYNQSQSAYRILVASSRDLLKAGKADVWDSRKVDSRSNAHVPFGGSSLESAKQYWWTVRVWNQDGTFSKWAKPQTFEMGLLQEADWQAAEFMSIEEDTRASEYRFRQKKTERMKAPETVTSYPTAYFRKEITIKNPVKSARAYVCALGYYELQVNGEKVGDHVLDPAPTTHPERTLYVTYDISDELEEENALGLILANGFYGQNLAFAADLSYGKPACKVLVRIEFDDGTIRNIASNSSWKVSTGPVVFDNVYGGETYDARYEETGWSKSGFNDEHWQSAQVVQPVVKEIAAQMLPPNRRTNVLPPVEVFKGADGNWIVDFGQILAGWVRVKPMGQEGTPIIIHSAEALTRKGDAIHPGSLGGFATGWNQEEIYVCNGRESAFWEPKFTYNSFRYVAIEGLQEKPTQENLQAVMVNSDVQKTGNFTSSDPLLNKMYEISEWTVLDNLHGYPEDCPAREKCGWLGDAHATAELSLYSFDIANLYEKYSHDIRTQLKPQNGRFTNKDRTFMVPTMIAPGKRSSTIAKLDWGIAEIYVPWYVYLHTGNRRLIDDHYSEMKDLVEYYLSFKDENGIIQNGMGDWCPPLWDRRDNPDAMECDPIVSANAYFHDILKIMQRMATMQQDPDFNELLDAETKSLKQAFTRVYLEPIGDNGGKWYGSQTGTVMALQFDMVPDHLKKPVINGLLHDIIEVKGEHHSTGIHGNRHIYTLLNDLGYRDLSKRLLTHPEFPSQAYIANAGLTTWPERQWEWASGIEWDRSLNHPMQAGFAALFYESIAGIRPSPDAPGFEEVIFKPTFWNGLEHAEARIGSPSGQIISSWKNSQGRIELEIEIPFNSRGKVILPVDGGTKISVKNGDQGNADSVAYGKQVLSFGSGKYRLTFDVSK